jgi:ribonuclease HII
MEKPDFSFENELWEAGIGMVAGLDEVGRGSFAGPVYAGCVVFKHGVLIPEEININDSKKLKFRERAKMALWIKGNSLTWGVGSASVTEINKKGLGKAASSAFRRALGTAAGKMGSRIEYLLIDAFYIPYTRGFPVTDRNSDLTDAFEFNSRQMAIKKGDAKSVSIAAASIVAKVERDNLMMRLGRREEYKVYKWAKNKGYGSKEHREAIMKYGTSRHHRTTFVNTYLAKVSKDGKLHQL